MIPDMTIRDFKSVDITVSFEFTQLNPHTQRYVCGLCGVDNMSEADLEEHTTLRKHKRKAKECAIRSQKRMARCALIVSKPLSTKIAKLEDIDDRKRDAIELALFRSAIGDDDDAYRTAIKTVMKAPRLHKHKERLVALALAVWKAQCIVESPEPGYLATMEWARSGWKASKANQRDSSAMEIVVMAVQPFLSLHDDDDDA